MEVGPPQAASRMSEVMRVRAAVQPGNRQVRARGGVVHPVCWRWRRQQNA